MSLSDTNFYFQKWKYIFKTWEVVGILRKKQFKNSNLQKKKKNIPAIFNQIAI